MAHLLSYHDDIYTQSAYIWNGNPSCVYVAATPRTMPQTVERFNPGPVRKDDDLTNPLPWEQHKNLLEKLWLDDDKELPKIMEIMERDHKFKASPRQYKTQFKNWKWRKNIKLEEALYIMRWKCEREQAGIGSAFRLRGRPVRIEHYERYLKRKGIYDYVQEANEKAVEMPDDLECSDLPLSPPMEPSTMQYASQIEFESQDLDIYTPSLTRSRSSVDGTSELASIATPVTGPSSYDHHCGSEVNIFLTPPSSAPRGRVPGRKRNTNTDQRKEKSKNLVRRTVLSPLARPPTPSSVERLIYNVKVLLWGSYESGHGLPTQSYQHGINLDHFESLWFSGYRLNLEGLHGAEMRIFNKVFSRAGDLLKSGDPRAMKYILDMLIHLARYLPEIDIKMRRYLTRMAQIVLPHYHPWRLIMMAILKMEKKALDFALLESWRVANDIYEERLGCYDQQYLASYPDYLASLEDGQDTDVSLYRLLQGLMAQYGRLDSRVLKLKLKYIWKVLDGDNISEALKLFNHLLKDTETAQNDEVRLRCLESIAGCHYQLGKCAEAESNHAQSQGVLNEAQAHAILAEKHLAAAEYYQWQAINLAITKRGVENIIRCETRLYGWFKRENRNAEASILSCDINTITGAAELS